MKNVLIKHWGFFVILVLSFFVIWPLFHPGFFPVHDDTQVQRVFEMGKSLTDGMFPVRWVNDLGYSYGYPIFTFYAPLAYYIGGAFVLFHLSALLATKLMFGLGIVLAGITMYLLGRSVWDEIGGTISGLLYLFAPYHALDIYVRGDVAEFWAYAMLPLAVYGMWQSVKTGKFRYIILGAIGFAGVILSHNLTAFMVLPFLAIFSGVLLLITKGWKRLFPLIVLLIGLGLSAFYFFPVPFEMAYTNVLSQVGGSNDFHRNFVCLQQLWYSPWGYGGSIPGCIDGISFALGKLSILLFVLSFLISPLVLIKNKEKGIVLITSILGGVFALCMLLQISEPIWNFIPQLAYLQYPWRFLILVFFFLSFASGSIIWLLQQLKIYGKLLAIFAGVIIVGLLVILEAKYFIPKQYNLVSSSFYTNKQMLIWNTSKISDEYMPKHFAIPQQEEEIPQSLFRVQKGRISLLENKTQLKRAIITMRQPGEVHINLAYFPAWSAFVDGKEVTLKKVSNGMDFSIQSGTHNVLVIYKDTLVEQIGNIVSLTSILGLIVAIIFIAKKKLL